MSEQTIYGIRAIMEAMESGKEIDKVFLKKGLSGTLSQEFLKRVQQNGIVHTFVPEEKLYKLGDRNHQGVVATISAIRSISLDELVSQYHTDKSLFLILDGITDVRNLGAIARTAACTGVSGIILPKNNSAPLSADAVKTSAGALYHIPVCKVDHLKDALYFMQASGIRILAATEKTDQKIYDVDLTGALALVMGSEDKGISENILKMVDERISLPMFGKIASLNVSVACGAMLYEAVRQRR
ncbi:MAG: 23S rRNA (guanosine(2251)-2'-O)-methyltransferase RlmB [Bacteroidetes bacterium]|jgi:23S rRNA (guanosine2251-2'-O)-methyltransferase|nr:23S rRNA (guanosine(2251)-2'-O)-methyltransferase RlmB [Bacteroidota bacterium]